MNNANLSSVASLLALSFIFALVGCAADEGIPEEKGESTSNLSCKVVPTEVVVGGKTVTTKKVVCDGSKGTTSGNGSSCTLNGRKMICESGCIAVNGQPGEGCRWADDANAPAQDPEDLNPDDADLPDFGPAGGTSSCTINGRKAVCDDGSCTSVNGGPGPGCRFVE